MQYDRRALAAHWFAAAAQDREVARIVGQTLPAPACFHAQQAAEKGLKGALVAVSGDAPRLHLLRLMLDDLESCGYPAPADVARAAQVLDRLYTPTRYPDAINGMDPTRAFSAEDANDAIVHADRVVLFSQEIVRAAMPEAPPA